MPARKLAVSFEKALAKEVRDAARHESGGNVSAWLAQAARERLRRVAAQLALEEFEARAGKLTKAELARADRAWHAG